MIKKSNHIVLIRFKVNTQIATGHMDNALNYRKYFKKKYNADVLLVLVSSDKFPHDYLKKFRINYIHDVELNNTLSQIEKLNYSKKTFMNDTLITPIGLAKKIKDLSYQLIICEETSPTTKYADIVLNPLYKKTLNLSNEFNGPEYFLLREEFTKEVKNLKQSKKNSFLISFGGIDKSHLSERVYSFLKNTNYNFKLLKPKFRNLELSSNNDNRIISDSVVNLAKLINESSFVVSSSGRTVYETWYLNKTSIVISQNIRECSHFTNDLSSVSYIGYQRYLTKEKFLITLENHLQKLTQNNFDSKIKENKLDFIFR